MIIDFKKVEAAQKGDKDMFAQVYDCVAPDLYKYAAYTLGNLYDAEDVVSETFLEAYKGIGKLRDPQKFKPWIMTILSARIKRKISEYVKHKNNVDIEDFSFVLSDDSNLGAELSDSVTVAQALATLSQQERQIINLSVMQGYTTKEIAAIIGSPQGTVSSKLHRALIKLRKLIETP